MGYQLVAHRQLFRVRDYSHVCDAHQLLCLPERLSKDRVVGSTTGSHRAAALQGHHSWGGETKKAVVARVALEHFDGHLPQLLDRVCL
jgi:hypothetical protein